MLTWLLRSFLIMNKTIVFTFCENLFFYHFLMCFNGCTFKCQFIDFSQKCLLNVFRNMFIGGIWFIKKPKWPQQPQSKLFSQDLGSYYYATPILTNSKSVWLMRVILNLGVTHSTPPTAPCLLETVLVFHISQKLWKNLPKVSDCQLSAKIHWLPEQGSGFA